MSLMGQIKQDQLQARKAREIEKASLLTTLIGEASIIGKNDGNHETTDEEVIRVIKKFIKGLQEVRHAADSAKLHGCSCEDEIRKCDFEIGILESYLPKMLTTRLNIISTPEGTGGVFPSTWFGAVSKSNSFIPKEILK